MISMVYDNSAQDLHNSTMDQNMPSSYSHANNLTHIVKPNLCFIKPHNIIPRNGSFSEDTVRKVSWE